MAAGGGGGLENLQRHCDHSYVKSLRCDPDNAKHAPNQKTREVFAGHYVLVPPTPLPEPYYVMHSQSMADELQLSSEDCKSDAFVRFFSGDTKALPAFQQAGSWATPYALSIYGNPRDPSPDTFGTGNGYGDGRAISIAEVKMPNGKRWEMQLKGAGRTPFSRTGDGRAVLRSSLREFLAEEAMAAMGVETTRGLSLIGSRTEQADRPWYSGGPVNQMRMGWGDPRDPDMMHKENCAISCRVAPSFIRVGHFELFLRRHQRGKPEAEEELKLLVQHALDREYPDKDPGPSAPMQARALALAGAFSEKLAKLAVDWIRVGYVQSNFNSDNCLVGGRTMDFGPFGFVEKYSPDWGMWVGTGGHFAFMNQPRAAAMNLVSFLRALVPLMDDEGKEQLQKIATEHAELSERELHDMWRRKMGLATWKEPNEKLWESLEHVFERVPTDWTIFWRNLAKAAEMPPDAPAPDMVKALGDCFYRDLDSGAQGKLEEWLLTWRKEVGDRGQEAAAMMRTTSPKYVPREWMLVDAYSRLGFDGKKDDRSVAQDLLRIFTSPFDEHPDLEGKYFVKQPAGTDKRGGVGFMT